MNTINAINKINIVKILIYRDPFSLTVKMMPRRGIHFLMSRSMGGKEGLPPLLVKMMPLRGIHFLMSRSMGGKEGH